MRGDTLLTVQGVCKRFGAVQALSGVDLEVRAGEVLGLVGSNGAGKTTLVMAVSGVTRPDGGSVRWKGRPVDLARPFDAQSLRIATVHQDLSLCDNLDTVNNLFLGREPRRFGLIDEVAMERRAQALMDSLSVRLPSLRVPVASLSAADRQSVAIARALVAEAELVVLDEPTAALGPRQAGRVLELVRRLRDQGVAVLYASPELDEVRAVADRVAVLRVGRNSGSFDPKYTTREQFDAAVTGNTEPAVVLQQSLLPRGLPEQNALDVGHRYLPARDGVGGDWFDVIPLPGARVALVVGDIVGHGMHAAATMGRLRTAVHNFSMLDLPPDDLLAHLDDLVTRIDADETAPDAGLPVTGATCLYAVYDPVSRRCELARAGHVPPALVRPDGTVEFLDVPAGPPLGVGGLPFEAVEREVPEGSRLVLYTDGLVADPGRDIDVGLDVLRAALAGPGRTPDQTCEAVLAALPPTTRRDDIALLVARTRALPAEDIARWGVPSDPSAVAAVRTEASRRLGGWGLEDLEFTTELILSELVTNSIRYATGPIEVRLLRDRGLICEVTDTSGTSPHLRYAETTDEGGRGLFLVAQLGERWGVRHTAHGKIIWVEQRFPDADG